MVSPVDGKTIVGSVIETPVESIDEVMAAAAKGFREWSRVPAIERAALLDRLSDLLEAERDALVALLAREGGKTLNDGIAEVREAVDFCRYYAAEARALFGDGEVMPGPTGERDVLSYRGRGVFVCISPWNFPLAIFLGQVAAALAAGNAVVAKPAEQTPLIAFRAFELLHEAGIPKAAAQLAPGDGKVGAALVAHPAVAGVAFTGSTEVAWAINRTLAAKAGPIVPLIAETGGINAMIVDATALPEQVTDDVVSSAFRSAGQRCSALRLLCLQDEVAEPMLAMIDGAAAELALGDPADPATDVGPVIDAEAKANLEKYLAAMRKARWAKLRYAGATPRGALSRGTYVAPHIVELDGPARLTREVFGPILHVVRWKAGDLDALTDAIAATGYGLTLGIHTRIDETVRRDRGAAPGRQRLRQPQHDRRGRRHPAFRRLRSLRHRAEGRRPRLSPPLRAGAGRLDQHRGGRRQRLADRDGRRVNRVTEARAVSLLAFLSGRLKEDRHVTTARRLCHLADRRRDVGLRRSPDKEKDAKLLAAIAACDKGAAAPLDPTATAPPIQFSELFGPTFNLEPLRAVADACKIAAEGRPDEKRLWLQWFRTEIALGERFDPSLTGRVAVARERGNAGGELPALRHPPELCGRRHRPRRGPGGTACRGGGRASRSAADDRRGISLRPVFQARPARGGALRRAAC